MLLTARLLDIAQTVVERNIYPPPKLGGKFYFHQTERIKGVGKQVIQEHHLIYPAPDRPEQEETVMLTKGEHKIATLMQWYCRKKVSKGFIKWLKFFLALNEDRAIELKEER